ncbi:aminoacyltransferase [Streptococcus lutetiensis]|uniref:aminoacyltransferase n=1 Tax=Streptococcus lutetiensis TaxID=150055 RepID=UPI001BDA4308|nr:aminoacyltransferase [Streptococcus lutetiensis]MBT0889882.1 aminoacyltransferase [Streptococcus lutetiensis]MBT0914781.1 aminoacyltransferase [Streptococcus lutetiensis]MBT0916471.1 aminoacyltransferase [Streptococcus lutetiensis]MBT0919886.1 aminoacyltransferase [Streptococcus lutetiensis]MBT0921571.1 aminoacyltransferase [Streptococcus lutetiensis]
MTLKILSREDYETLNTRFKERSFMQTVEMADLLEKRGFDITFLGLETDGAIQVAGVLYSMPMTGGLHMEINSGPASTSTAYLSEFYKELKAYAKENGAFELIVKPYDTYQSFDNHGNPNDDEKPELISCLTDLGYSYDGLQTGYPGGEPDWHYVKDLSGLTPETLRKSFSKKGRPLVNKTNSFGIKVRKLTRDELHIFKEITASTSERREYTDKPLDYYEAFYDSFGDKCEFVIATINFQDYLKNMQAGHDKIAADLAVLNQKIAEGVNSAKVNKQKAQLDKQISTFDIRLKEAKELIQKHGSEDVVLAGCLFVYTPQEAVYLFSGSYTEFNKFYAPVALQEHVMMEALKRGINFYTFLGIQGIFDGSDGVLRFKQNFNGYIVRKMGTFRYYPRPMLHKIIAIAKKILRR